MFTYILFVLIVLNGSNLAAAGVIDSITNQLKEECAVALEWGHIKTPHPIDDLLENEKYFSVDTEAINLLYLSSNKQYIATIDPTQINCAGSLWKRYVASKQNCYNVFCPRRLITNRGVLDYVGQDFILTLRPRGVFALYGSVPSFYCGKDVGDTQSCFQRFNIKFDENKSLNLVFDKFVDREPTDVTKIRDCMIKQSHFLSQLLSQEDC